MRRSRDRRPSIPILMMRSHCGGVAASSSSPGCAIICPRGQSTCRPTRSSRLAGAANGPRAGRRASGRRVAERAAGRAAAPHGPSRPRRLGALPVLLAAVQLVYAGWLANAPDWATVRVQMVLSAALTTIYAMALTLVLLTPSTRISDPRPGRSAAAGAGLVRADVPRHGRGHLVLRPHQHTMARAVSEGTARHIDFSETGNNAQQVIRFALTR